MRIYEFHLGAVRFIMVCQFIGFRYVFVLPTMVFFVFWCGPPGDVLGFSVKNNLRTKTGMMVGLGERFDEVIDTMRQVSDLGVKLFTIGQYLQPTKSHLPVDRYVEEQEFNDYKNIGIEMGFELVKSGSLVRSSYHADEQARMVFNHGE